MRVISKRALREFWKNELLAKQPLEDWYRLVKGAGWETFDDIRKTFRHADVFRDCVIFDIGGNKYRLIAKVHYQRKKIFIRFVMNHSDYDKGNWKSDC
jgi:mRNA interferase HigB